MVEAEIHELFPEKVRKEIEERFKRVIQTKEPATDLNLLSYPEVQFVILFDKDCFPEEDKIHICTFESLENPPEPIGVFRLTKEQWDVLQQKVNDSFAKRKSVDE